MSSPDPNAEWWTIRDVAAHLGIAPQTVSAYLHDGRLPEPRARVGQSPIWVPDEIIKWHASRPGRGRPKKT